MLSYCSASFHVLWSLLKPTNWSVVGQNKIRTVGLNTAHSSIDIHSNHIIRISRIFFNMLQNASTHTLACTSVHHCTLSVRAWDQADPTHCDSFLALFLGGTFDLVCVPLMSDPPAASVSDSPRLTTSLLAAAPPRTFTARLLPSALPVAPPARRLDCRPVHAVLPAHA